MEKEAKSESDQLYAEANIQGIRDRNGGFSAEHCCGSQSRAPDGYAVNAARWVFSPLCNCESALAPDNVSARVRDLLNET